MIKAFVKFISKIYSHKSLPIIALGCGLLSAQYITKPAFCEEEQKVEKADADLELEMPQLDSFEEITDENMQEVMTNTESKFIFYFDPDKVNNDYLDQINKHAQKMNAGLGCTSYYVDMKKYGDQLKEFLKQRNMSKELQEQIDTNTFILANKHDDVSLYFNCYGDRQVINIHYRSGSGTQL